MLLARNDQIIRWRQIVFSQNEQLASATRQLAHRFQKGRRRERIRGLRKRRRWRRRRLLVTPPPCLLGRKSGPDHLQAEAEQEAEEEEEEGDGGGVDEEDAGLERHVDGGLQRRGQDWRASHPRLLLHA